MIKWLLCAIKGHQVRRFNFTGSEFVGNCECGRKRNHLA